MTSLATPPALSVRGLTKRFGPLVALDGLDLDVRAGEVVSVLGANGSGKSTTLRCLSGLTRFDAGSVTVAGRDVSSGENAPEFAMIFQKIHLVSQLSALENVCAGALGRLSGGQQQRTAVARALCQRALVLLADEPVSALDPAAAEQVMRLLRSLADDGMAVVAVLHQPDLARRHSDRIVGLTDGRITLDSARTPVTDVDIDGLYAPDYALEGGFA